MITKDLIPELGTKCFAIMDALSCLAESFAIMLTMPEPARASLDRE
jgi:hypothetical protein